MNQPIYADRRRGRRIPYRARVRSPKGGVECRTTSLSVGGLYLQRLSAERFRLDQPVDLIIDLPIGAIRARGRVASVVDEVFYQGASVVFFAMSDAHRSMLADFVHNRRKARPKGVILARIPLVRHRISVPPAHVEPDRQWARVA
jgi:hypothetical protein